MPPHAICAAAAIVAGMRKVSGMGLECRSLEEMRGLAFSQIVRVSRFVIFWHRQAVLRRGRRSACAGADAHAGIATSMSACVRSFVHRCMSRVNGTLAVARAMGDFSFKREKKMSAEEQQVTCDPEIRKFGLEGTDEFLILACDGIWDVMTSQAAVDFVGGKMKEGKGLKEILAELFDHCLSPHPSANEVRAPHSLCHARATNPPIVLHRRPECEIVLQQAVGFASLCVGCRVCGTNCNGQGGVFGTKIMGQWVNASVANVLAVCWRACVLACRDWDATT